MVNSPSVGRRIQTMARRAVGRARAVEKYQNWPASLVAPEDSSAPYLQVALDLCDVEGAIRMLDATADVGEKLPEVLEVGTPVVIEEGLEAVRQLKTRYPRQRVLADLKIMDAGEVQHTKARMPCVKHNPLGVQMR